MAKGLFVRDETLDTQNGWTLHFLFRTAPAEIEMLIHYTLILSTTLRKLAWRALVAEIARLSEQAGDQWGRVNELMN